MIGKNIKGTDLGIEGVDYKLKGTSNEGSEIRPVVPEAPPRYSVTTSQIASDAVRRAYEFMIHNARYSIFLTVIFFWIFHAWLVQNAFELGIMAQFFVIDAVLAYLIASFIDRHGYKYIPHLHIEVPGLNTVVGVNPDEVDALKSILYEKSEDLIVKLFLRRQDHLTTRKAIIAEPTRITDRDGNTLLFTQHSAKLGKKTVYSGTMSKKYMAINILPALFPLAFDNERVNKTDRVIKKRLVRSYNRLMKKAPREMTPEENEKFIEAVKQIMDGEENLSKFTEEYRPVRVFFRGRDKTKKGYMFSISKEVQKRMIETYGNPYDPSDGKETNRIKQLTNLGQNADILISQQSSLNAKHYARGQKDTLAGVIEKRYSEKMLSKEVLLEKQEHAKSLKKAADEKTEEDIMREALGDA